jgi:hypothetical protein
MRYLALIYQEEQDGSTMDPARATEQTAAYDAFTESVRAAGAFLGGEALQPTSAATTVRVRDGRTLTTDGPFAETREALGGFYLLTCRNLDEAIEWATQIPGARHGSIELRPIREYGPADAPVAGEAAGDAG